MSNFEFEDYEVMRNWEFVPKLHSDVPGMEHGHRPPLKHFILYKLLNIPVASSERGDLCWSLVPKKFLICLEDLTAFNPCCNANT